MGRHTRPGSLAEERNPITRLREGPRKREYPARWYNIWPSSWPFVEHAPPEGPLGSFCSECGSRVDIEQQNGNRWAMLLPHTRPNGADCPGGGTGNWHLASSA